MGNTLIAQANALSEEFKYQEAIDTLNQVLVTDPNNAIAQNNKGNALVMLERYEESLECYEKSHELDSSVPYPLIGKSLAYLNLGKYQDALTCCEKGLQLGYNRVWFEGIIRLKLGDVDNAIASFDRAINIEGEAPLFISTGIALEVKGKFKEAEAAYDEALKFDNKIVEAYVRKGDLLMSTAYNYKDAIVCFNNALRLDPQSIEAIFYKALALIREGQSQEALECCDRLNDEPAAYHALYYSTGKVVAPDYKRDFKIRMCKLMKRPPPIALVRGLAYSEMGDQEQAKQSFDEVVNMTTQDAFDHFFVGQALSELSMNTLAVRCFTQALRLDPAFHKKRQVEAYLLQFEKEQQQ
jgi:tetratricopeptide (TPR) repeat protein